MCGEAESRRSDIGVEFDNQGAFSSRVTSFTWSRTWYIPIGRDPICCVTLMNKRQKVDMPTGVRTERMHQKN